MLIIFKTEQKVEIIENIFQKNDIEFIFDELENFNYPNLNNFEKFDLPAEKKQIKEILFEKNTMTIFFKEINNQIKAFYDAEVVFVNLKKKQMILKLADSEIFVLFENLENITLKIGDFVKHKETIGSANEFLIIKIMKNDEEFDIKQFFKINTNFKLKTNLER